MDHGYTLLTVKIFPQRRVSQVSAVVMIMYTPIAIGGGGGGIGGGIGGGGYCGKRHYLTSVHALSGEIAQR